MNTRNDGCSRPDPRPLPPNGCGGYLMQRILACGKVHHRPECVFLCPDELPRGAQPPFTVLDAWVTGPAQWQEMPACSRQAQPLRVRIPAALRIRDGCGSLFTIEKTLEAELTLRFSCPGQEAWRGQIYLQACIRPWRGCRPRQGGPWEAAIELLAEGFLLAACPVPLSAAPCCPDPRPLYPQPRFDPYGS